MEVNIIAITFKSPVNIYRIISAIPIPAAITGPAGLGTFGLLAL
jgi:hypothetical protein